MVEAFDLLVIGGGTGGYTAAIRASQMGMKAALIEMEKVGGVCLHKGCIPTKVLLESAERLALVRKSKVFGIEAGEARLDYSYLRQRQDEVVGALYQGLRSTIQKQGVRVIEGRGRLLSPGRVEVDGEVMTAARVVIATGSRPQELPGLAVDGRRVITSDHALTLPAPPRSLAIIGAGAVGLEFASFFLDVGAQVTIIEAMPRLAPLEDAGLSTAIARTLEARGAQVITSARVQAEKTLLHDDEVELVVSQGGAERTVRAEKALIAIGRRANVEGLGLEESGLAIEKGFIMVDETMQSTQPGVYAVGDVTGGMLLAHVASAEGEVAAKAAAGQEYQPLDYSRVPRVIYTRPHMAAVGLTEEEARAQGRKARSRRFSFRYNARARILDEMEGFAKVVTDAESGDLLGLHVFGANAAELIGEGALARWLDASTWELAAAIHPHPSLNEALSEAAQLSLGMSIWETARGERWPK